MRNSHIALAGLFGVVNLMSTAYAQTPLTRDWSGVYFGGSLGSAEGSTDTRASTSSGFPTSYFQPPSEPQVEDAADGQLSQWNLSGGLFAGYGKQFGKLYVGVEGSANSLSFDESRTSGEPYIVVPSARFSYTQSVEADWQATLRARLGWAEDRWLAYVTGGAAVSQIRLDTAFSDTTFGGGASGRDSTTDTKWGWVLGLGGEYALSNSWTIRGEYLYADFGKVSTDTVIAHPASSIVSNSIKGSAEFKTQTVSLGMAYRF
ncbi:outer membrane protein [Pseudomonas sp. EA_35y_Pfl2_R5]